MSCNRDAAMGSLDGTRGTEGGRGGKGGGGGGREPGERGAVTRRRSAGPRRRLSSDQPSPPRPSSRASPVQPLCRTADTTTTTIHHHHRAHTRPAPAPSCSRCGRRLRR
ncbi:hypothetical protein PLESTF_000859700 [Pleodorina starrii]|nr:hypothetical protein PLESTF_000859700 [Pleodorina starrii]